MKWIVIVGVLLLWFVIPPLFSAMANRDASDFRTGIKSAYSNR